MEFRFTTENFEEEVLQSSVPVLVDFFADWCGPCKMMAPIVEKLAEEYDGRVKVGKCNTDENLQVAQRYRISSIPTFIIFKDGKPAATFMGAMSAKDLKDEQSYIEIRRKKNAGRRFRRPAVCGGDQFICGAR